MVWCILCVDQGVFNLDIIICTRVRNNRSKILSQKNTLEDCSHLRLSNRVAILEMLPLRSMLDYRYK